MQTEGWNLEHTYTKLPKIFYHYQSPTTSPIPQMAIFNHSLAQSLGLDSRKLEHSPEIFAGSVLPHGAEPISQAYAGYQFGHFVMLGDGRAVLLGEQITPDGRRFDIQLKGSGPTPFSHNGDGYAALAPMLREYIISEVMHYLGIPTTRSLSVALTGRDIYRQKALKGAVLTRVASSHIRVGTFDYVSAFGTVDDTKKLADYSIHRHYPGASYVEFLREVAKRQASLIASWQLVGFIHGVMNTDNMAISGETIDYGPCAFMDSYDPSTVFSSIDTAGRYSYKNQPSIGAWNLSRFAEALLPLIHNEKNKAIELANGSIEYYWECYEKFWLSGMRNKIGITNEEQQDIDLISELLQIMETHKLDFTNTFRNLPYPTNDIHDLISWQKKWQTRLSRQPKTEEDIVTIMKMNNPAIIPRNHQVEEALAAAEHGDMSITHHLLSALRNPYEESDIHNIYSLPPKSTACKYQTFCGT